MIGLTPGLNGVTANVGDFFLMKKYQPAAPATANVGRPKPKIFIFLATRITSLFKFFFSYVVGGATTDVVAGFRMKNHQMAAPATRTTGKLNPRILVPFFLAIFIPPFYCKYLSYFKHHPKVVYSGQQH